MLCDKEKKYKYYFWLDEMVMDLWCQYIDLLVLEESNEVCENKYKMIEFYQKQINELEKDFSYKEAYSWWRKKYKTPPNQKTYEKIFNHDM